MHYYIYLILILLSAIFSLRSFRLKWPAPYRIFSAFLILTFIAEVFAIAWKWYLHDMGRWDYKPNNHWLYNIFHIGRYTLLILFYLRIISSAIGRKIISVSGILIICIGIINYFFIQTPFWPNSYTLVLTNISGIIMSLLYFKQAAQAPNPVKMRQDPAFWISLGMFIYCSGSIPYFIYTSYLFHVYPSIAFVLFINQVLNVIQYSLYLIAFLCRPYRK